MSAHLTDEQLEAPGEAASHLAECAECRAKVARAEARQKLVGGLKPYTLAEVAFSRVEAKLMEHVREHPPGPRWTFGRIFAIGAMAAVVALLAVTTVRPLLEQTPPMPVAAFEPMTVVFASGVALKAGAVVGRDAVVDAQKGRVVLSTADGTALRLAGGCTLVLGTGSETVRLTSGTLSVDAKGRGPWVVQVGEHWLRSADASFDVAPDQLQLYRGSVLLADNAWFNNPRQVNAPTVLRLGDGSVSTIASDPLVKVLAATAPLPWARLELPLEASEVELDGQQLGGAPLSLMTGLGKHRVRAKVGEQWREADIELTTSGTGIVDLPEKVAVAPLGPPPGPLVEADPTAIAAAVKAQLPKLRVCHEKWLKVNEGARGKVMMTVTVSPKGRVTRAKFSAEEGVPEAVSECLGRAVRAMKLPTSSEEVELEIPVLLGAQN